MVHRIDLGNETVTQILYPPLKIAAEGTVREADLFGRFVLGDLPAFDEILDTLPCIAGKVSVRTQAAPSSFLVFITHPSEENPVVCNDRRCWLNSRYHRL